MGNNDIRPQSSKFDDLIENRVPVFPGESTAPRVEAGSALDYLIA
jgi:hypothetical protein